MPRKRPVSISTYSMEVDGLEVEVKVKPIRSLYLRVRGPDGPVRVSAPLRASRGTVRDLVRSKWSWIQRHRERWAGVPTSSPPRWSDGETHWIFGEPCRLVVREDPSSRPGLTLGRASDGEELRALAVRGVAGSDHERIRGRVEDWYREQLRRRIPGLIRTWEPILGVVVREWRIRKMRTRWGSCNVRAGRIWLALELARRSPRALEYVVVHEMIHLLERRHNRRFWGLMDRFLPDWREAEEELRRGPGDRLGRLEPECEPVGLGSASRDRL